ncbi:MGMT family protein, partial [Xanthovirga aplysinae]|uniref:MGMT family protein n=1 Tax=Xanthovirga aplysinae TaxID=2529853 RepID=UPI0012BD3841
MSASKEDFFKDVYEVVKLVPSGRVTTYGAIAAFLGRKGSARIVGWAMNNAHNLINVPAHRVVNRIGMLTGKHHFGHPSRMQELLEAEGVSINNDKVMDFKSLFWDPA